MFQQLLCQLFSDQCQLISLQLDIRNSSYDTHQCLKSYSHLPSNTISQSYCVTLRRVDIHLDYRCFLEHLIEHVPNLEQLSVQFRYSLMEKPCFDSNIQSSIISKEIWFNKVRQM